MKIIKPSATLNWITPDAEKQIEKIAKVCYQSEHTITEDSYKKFIKGLIIREHGAMLEHASASIKFICDRGVSHELVRHRMSSFAQESTRYCNYSKDKFENEITVIEPDSISSNFAAQMLWKESCETAEVCYMTMLKKGIKPEIARAVLPTCLKTELNITANMREWIHIFKLRTDSTAHPQAREVMTMALNILFKECPVIFESLYMNNNIRNESDIEIFQKETEIKELIDLHEEKAISTKFKTYRDLVNVHFRRNFKYKNYETDTFMDDPFDETIEKHGWNIYLRKIED